MNIAQASHSAMLQFYSFEQRYRRGRMDYLSTRV